MQLRSREGEGEGVGVHAEEDDELSTSLENLVIEGSADLTWTRETTDASGEDSAAEETARHDGTDRHSSAAAVSWYARVDWPLWANLFFLLGSVLWLASPLDCWRNGEPDRCYDIGVAGGVSFIVDALLYFAAAFVNHRKGYDVVYGASHLRRRTRGWRYFVQRLDYLLWVNVLFSIGVVSDLIVAIFDRVDEDRGSHVLNLIANIVWSCAAFLELCRWYVDAWNRRKLGASVHFTLLSCCSRKEDGTLLRFHYDAIGSLLFLLGAWLYLVSEETCTYSDSLPMTEEVACWLFESLAAFAFIFSALFVGADYLQHKKLERMGFMVHTDSTTVFEAERPAERTSIRTSTERSRLI